MITLISFDLDDTLWDAGPVLARAEDVQYAWVARHLPRAAAAHTVEDLQHRRRLLAREQPQLAHDFTQLRLAALRELCIRYDYPVNLAETGIEAFLEARSTVELYTEVDTVLRELGASYRLAALTNGNTNLARAGVAAYFEFALSPAETGVSKPDPRMFEAMLAQADVAPGAVVHVGDEPYHDIEGAHRANIRSIWINRNAREWPAEYRRAHAEITTLDELPAVLAQLTAGQRT